MCTREFVGLVSFGLGEGLISLDVLDEAHGDILDVQPVERMLALVTLAIIRTGCPGFQACTSSVERA